MGSFLSRALMIYCESKNKRLLAVYHKHSLFHLDNGLDVNISSSTSTWIIFFCKSNHVGVRLHFWTHNEVGPFPRHQIKRLVAVSCFGIFWWVRLCANLPFILHRSLKIIKYAWWLRLVTKPDLEDVRAPGRKVREGVWEHTSSGNFSS